MIFNLVMALTQYLPLALFAGSFSYLAYFHRGEHHLFPMRLFQLYVLAFVLSVVVLVQYGALPTTLALKTMSALAGCYFVGLYTSLAVYRLFLNPLNRFPGPYANRLSKFCFALTLRKLDAYLQMQKLHKRYGRYVRIGPNDLSVTDPEAVEIVLGAKSKCGKSPWYDQGFPFNSMHTTRAKPTHDRRRRIWSPAFSDKAIRGYENRVQQYNDKLIDQIKAYSRKPMDMSKWFNLYSFDVMGDLAFGKSYNMLESGEQHWSLKLLSEGMDPAGMMLPTWFFRFLIAIPGLAAGYHRFVQYCVDQIEERMKMDKMENPDIANSLVEHFKESPDPRTERPLLHADSRLIIVAGSDTTAATLAHLFYHLAADPSVVDKMRAELMPLTEKGANINHPSIQDAPYLNGCINEALRLHPPVPSGVFRKTPPEGIQVGDTFIPGDTTLQLHSYTMGHDDAIYPRASEFLPERWSDSPDLIKHRDAFVPFSIGPFGCIGKNLAYMEVRLLVAQLVLAFDVRLADGEDGGRLLWKTRDHFTVDLGGLDLVWRAIKRR